MKNKSLLKHLVLVSVLIGILLVGCAKKDPGTIKIGLLSVFSDKGADYGKTARTGVDLAVEEINAAGGIKGKRVEIVYEDSKGNPKDAINGFQKLATVDKVPVVIGPFYSGEVLACAPEAEKNKVVLISGSATSDNITLAGDYVFRVCPTNEEQARTIAAFCDNELKAKRVYTLFRNVDYGVTLRDRFKEAFVRLGGIVVGEEGIAADATDVRSQLGKVESANPDVIFAAVHYPEGSTILRQAKELGIRAYIVGTDGGYDPELLKIAGTSAEGSFWATIGWGESEANTLKEEFMAKYKQKYGEEPGSYSGLYYDAMKVVARALSESHSWDGIGVKTALYKIHDYKGPTGITDFDSLGEVKKPFSIYRVVDGQFTLVK